MEDRSEPCVQGEARVFYSLYASMEVVLGYLDAVDPAAARRARARYGCLWGAPLPG
jgi:erythromycin esterase-like protein